MNNRIKKIRQATKLNQTEFGARIGVKQATIASYECGLRVPIDAIIASICREFDVNEDWLRTGEGEMFIKKSRNQEIAAFFGDVLKGEPDFRRRLIAALAKMSPAEWEMLERKLKEIMSEDEPEPDTTP